MPLLLLAGPPKTAGQGRAENSINGTDAEAFAMAKVILACRGEGQWGSRQDDNSKIDMMFVANHPWHKGERLLVLCQVKSGPSYGSILKNGDGFKLTGSAKAAAKRSSHDICVIWVDRDKNRAFWAYIHPESVSDIQTYGSNHEISPALIFDLARCMAKKATGNGAGGRGVTLPGDINDFVARRSIAKNSYRRVQAINSPVLGKIELTRLGWRHMFRKSRAASNKNASLNLIPRLPVVLESYPSTMAVTSTRYHRQGAVDHRVCEYLLKYDHVTLQKRSDTETQKVTAHVRVIEEITYPMNWESQAMLSQLVGRRVVLKSAYYKK